MRRVVGRCGPEDLPGGAVALLKAARKAGGWYAFTTAGTITKPVKILAAKDNGGTAVYEDRPFPRLLVKGRGPDGRRFVVQYLKTGERWACETAYVHTTEHRCEAPGALTSWTDTKKSEPSTPHRWTTEEPLMRAASIAEVKAYVAGDVPSGVSDTPNVRREAAP